MAEENAAQSWRRRMQRSPFGLLMQRAKALMQRTQLTCVLMQRAFSANDRATARECPLYLISAKRAALSCKPLH